VTYSRRSEDSNSSYAFNNCNIKNESKRMTAHNSRDASNSRNESNNETNNTVGTPEKAGMLALVVKPTKACREAIYSKIPLILLRMAGAAGDNRTIMDVNSRRNARIRQWECQNFQQGLQQQQQKLTNTTRTLRQQLAGTSQMLTAEGRHATTGILATV
jgi:hypothetical protein